MSLPPAPLLQHKTILTCLGSERNSILLDWSRGGIEDPSLAYTVQIEDRAYEWITKYWGRKTKARIDGLGPEDLYTVRVGVSKEIGEGNWCEEVWSDPIVVATKFDLPWTFYLFQDVQQNAAANVVAFGKKRDFCLDVYNKYGDTPLTLAVRERKDESVEALVDSGADISLPGKPLRKTPLMVACFGGYKAAADALVNRGVNWDMVDSNRCQALHYAVDGCQLEMVRYGIDRGADVNAQDKFGWTPLMRGVLIGCNLKILSLLIENGADADLKDQNGMRALDLARLLGCQPDIVKLLEEHTTVVVQETKELPTQEDDLCELEDQGAIEARMEEEEDIHAAELMKKVDTILAINVSDDQLIEVDDWPRTGGMSPIDDAMMPSS
ncbi:Ankyrin repeat [Nesidiocoris tenuis]|uniref:Ankyrin repeat n=1 Tax=Nesidiocoris tenuis TaxID=355587 RepID=A0ABN7AXB7_9HEMI|nr:Ankyrin repeat [Nesidiocoris tenuis]